ncbi:MAG: PAAR domain-containing protein [Desulfobacterota bacterium]|nr:PAAR domain-containing protein [Thermodesulfobacteriota bacterium]
MPYDPQDHFNTVLEGLAYEVNMAIKPFKEAAGIPNPGEPPPPPQHPLRTAQQVASGVMGMVNLPLTLMNTGFALLTDPIAQLVPAFQPAATMGSLYLGIPHPHAHPPSLVPPAPPIPMPSFGPVLVGNCVTVLIEGRPAARAGDLGFAVSCCGFVPVFEIFTGSSNTFIGGTRAARVGDICRECQPAAAGWARAVAAGMALASQTVSALGVAADTAEAIAESDAAMAAAKTISASAQAAQMATDAAAFALSQAMGKDPALIPAPGFLISFYPSVQIGGFPMINFPNPSAKLLEKLGRLRRRKNPSETGDQKAGASSCPL